MQQHSSKDFAYRPQTLTLGMGSVGPKAFFSKHTYVAYQVKENHECSNMEANILPADPHPSHPDHRGRVSRSKFNFL